MSKAWIESESGELKAVDAETVLVPRNKKKQRGYKPRHRIQQQLKNEDGGYNYFRLALLAAVGASPILSIALFSFGVIDLDIALKFVVAPAIVVFILLYVARTLEAKVAIRGLFAGIVAVFLYDVVRIMYTLMGVLKDFFPILGGLALGTEENFIVGYLWRFVGNGGGIGVVFFLLCAVVLKRIPFLDRHVIVFGVLYGVFVWCGLIATVLFSEIGPELFFEFSFAPAAATFLGHVVYGAALGVVYLWFGGKQSFKVPHLAWAVVVGLLVALGLFAAISDVQSKAGLARECIESDLEPHDGSQNGPRCVSLPFGEVAAEQDIPQLLITDAPEEVTVDEEFEINISTRNLVRDIFLPAGDNLYYVAPAELNDDGLTPGHVHMACRLLPSQDEAPASDVVPDFFVVNDDGNGSRDPDEFTFVVPGIEAPGTLQCAAWAGDISHRIPMQVRANQTPAFDVTYIEVAE